MQCRWCASARSSSVACSLCVLSCGAIICNTSLIYFTATLVTSVRCKSVNQQLVLHACSAFALEAARLLKQRGSDVSSAPTPPPPPPADDPEDGELPEAPALGPGPGPALGPGPGPAPEAASRKRKHSPIVWREAGKQSGMPPVNLDTFQHSTFSR